MSGKHLNPIFHGSRQVLGGSAVLHQKLQEEINYDGVRVVESGIVTTDATGNIKSTHWTTLGSPKMGFMSPKSISPEANTDIHGCQNPRPINIRISGFLKHVYVVR